MGKKLPQSGNGFSRRDFLKRVSGAAAAAAANRVLPADSAAALPAPPAPIDPRSLLHESLSEGFDLPGNAGRLQMLGGKAVHFGPENEFVGYMSRQRMQQAADAMNAARRSMPALEQPTWASLVNRALADGQDSAVTDLPSNLAPLHYNHLTGQWHAAVRMPTERPDVYNWRYLKAGELPPKGFAEFADVGDLAAAMDDVQESGYYYGTLSHPPSWPRGGNIAERPGNAIESFQQQWLGERAERLKWERNQVGEDARKIDPELLEDFNLAPGGRPNHDLPLGAKFYSRGPLTGLLDETSLSENTLLPGEDAQSPRNAKAARALRYATVLAPLLAGFGEDDSRNDR